MDSKYFLSYIFSLVKFWVSIDKDVLSTENVDQGNRLCHVYVWYSTAAGAWDREGWWLHCDSLPLTGPFRYLVIISHHQQQYRNHYYHHHQNHHHKHQLDKTIRVARVKTVSQSFSNYNLKVTVREEFDTPTTQDIRQWRLLLVSQLRRSKDAWRCFSGSKNDWKRMIRSLENPGVYENPCGDLMLLALAHSLCVDIILFNMRRTSAPIYPVSSTVAFHRK